MASQVVPLETSNLFAARSERTAGLWLKRWLDVSVAAALLVLLLPLLAAIGLLIWVESGEPSVIYRATRVGQGGRRFSMLKFRTMVNGADCMLDRVLHLNLCQDRNGMIKIPDDPRVTGIGRVLRRYSLDELPQLLNVLSGEMSFVGPRPPEPNEIDLDRYEDRVRLSMRPGLTGLWQVTDRTHPSSRLRVQRDAAYVRNWSLWLDCRILFKTIPVVLAGQGGTVQLMPAIEPAQT